MSGAREVCRLRKDLPNARWVEAPTSHIPAHTSPAAVAPFRAWPSSQVSVAGGPMGASIDSLSHFENGRDYPLTPATMQEAIRLIKPTAALLPKNFHFGKISNITS